MFDRIRDRFASVDWETLFSHVSNDKLVEYFTHPYGMAALGLLLIVSVICKWRITFVALAGTLMATFVMRYTLVGGQTGPDKTVLMFTGGAVAVGAFVIYYLFIRED